MEVITKRLVNKVEQINDYLVDRIEREPNYHDFIQELKLIITNFQQTKLNIKFVSKFVTLAEQLKQISQQQFTDRSLYKFQTVSDLSNIDNILENCDVLCLVCDSQTNICQLDKKLIRRASKRNICQTILTVERVKDERHKAFQNNCPGIRNWLARQNYHNIKMFFLSLDLEQNCDLSEQINNYYYFLEKLLFNREAKLEASINQIITQKVTQLLTQHKRTVWHQIQQTKIDLRNLQQEYSQHKSSLLLQDNQNKQQNSFKKLKQKIDREKINIVNPFIPDSLIYKVSKLVDRSEVSLLKESQQQYLHLIIKEKDFSQRLITVVIDLCQEELANWVAEKWQEIEQVYAPIALDSHPALNQTQLELIDEYSVAPNFELTNFVSLSILEESSKIIFDYNFCESSWFRLIIAASFGLILFFLTGKFFGFIFFIFQILNLLTGKDVRTIKLDRQTKTLQKNLDNKYQSLVRFLADRALHVIISALENKNQKYQEIIDNLTEESTEKLTELKQIISQHQEKLHNLRQDEIEILSLLE